MCLLVTIAQELVFIQTIFTSHADKMLKSRVGKIISLKAHVSSCVCKVHDSANCTGDSGIALLQFTVIICLIKG